MSLVAVSIQDTLLSYKKGILLQIHKCKAASLLQVTLLFVTRFASLTNVPLLAIAQALLDPPALLDQPAMIGDDSEDEDGNGHPMEYDWQWFYANEWSSTPAFSLKIRSDSAVLPALAFYAESLEGLYVKVGYFSGQAVYALQQKDQCTVLYFSAVNDRWVLRCTKTGWLWLTSLKIINMDWISKEEDVSDLGQMMWRLVENQKEDHDSTEVALYLVQAGSLLRDSLQVLTLVKEARQLLEKSGASAESSQLLQSLQIQEAEEISQKYPTDVAMLQRQEDLASPAKKAKVDSETGLRMPTAKAKASSAKPASQPTCVPASSDSTGVAAPAEFKGPRLIPPPHKGLQVPKALQVPKVVPPPHKVASPPVVHRAQENRGLSSGGRNKLCALLGAYWMQEQPNISEKAKAMWTGRLEELAVQLLGFIKYSKTSLAG